MATMMSNQELLDASIRRAIGIEGLKGSKRRKIIRFLRKMERAALASDMDGPQRALVKEIRDVLAPLMADFVADLYKDIDELTVAEARFVHKMLDDGFDGRAVRQASPRALRSAVYSRPFSNMVLADWVQRFDVKVRKEIEGAIVQGVAEGLPFDDIARRVREVGHVSERSAMALVRTSYTHITNHAANEVFKANKGLIDGVRWVSVLDSRTTAVCRSLDGQTFPTDEGPRPPLHVNCRSRVVPFVDDGSEYERETYGEWLARQDISVQDEALGKKKAALWREGKLELEDFVEPVTGRELRLDELPGG